ncbi:MAG: putative toxin-antitoxin system toxin component, PIN family [Pyrinomonadaceae bacterium]
MRRTVPDTNISISGLLWRGNPRRILDAARDGIIELYTSPVLLEELEDVLSREKFARRLAAANVTVPDLISGYSALATVIEAGPIEPVILVDPDDDAVLACALSAEAEVIVSGDSDLLDLKEHKGIHILTATEFLAELAL